MTRPSTFYFDIESGGFKARRNPLISVSFAERQRKVQSKFAVPTEGTYLSAWAEQVVVSQTLNKKRTSEKEVLMKFLNVLEGAPEDSRLIGWNIGYTPHGQDIARGTGFDVPFLIDRAREYGLEKRYQKAFKRVRLHDEGATWAYRIAKSVEEKGFKMVQEGRLEETLFTEAVGYMKKARHLTHQQGLRGEREIVRALSKEDIRFAGWKQESIFKQLFGDTRTGRRLIQKAHESEADVKMLRMIRAAGKQFRLGKRQIDEGFLEIWGRETLENKIVSSVKYGGGRERYLELMQQAEEWGVKEGATTKLRQLSEASKVPWYAVESGHGILQGERLVREQIVSERAGKAGFRHLAGVLDEVIPFISRHRGKIGLAAGAGALILMNRGNVFSGKDDEYNVLEGLPHGGMAERMRHMFTDFGSGWIRKALSKGISQEKVLEAAGKLGNIGSITDIGLQHGGKLLDAQLKGYRKGIGTTLEGQFWAKGEEFGRGAMGVVTKVYGPKGKVGVLKEAVESGDQIQQALAAGATTKSALMERYESHLKTQQREWSNRGIFEKVSRTLKTGEMSPGSTQLDILEDYIPEYGMEMHKQLGKQHYIGFEAQMTKRAREVYGDIVPEVYATGEKSFIQEFAGKQLEQPTTGVLEFMKSMSKQALSPRSPVLHLDLHKGQILRKGARYQLADWGAAIQQQPGMIAEEGLAVHRMAIAHEASVVGESVRGIKPQLYTPKPDMSVSQAKEILEQTPITTPDLTPVGRPSAALPPGPDPNKLAKLQAMNLGGTTSPPPGAGAMHSRKKIDTEWESPVNLTKAANKASKMFKSKPGGIASRQQSSIIEANNAKMNRKQKMQQFHRKAQVQQSSYSLRPGKRHRGQAGRLVN